MKAFIMAVLLIHPTLVGAENVLARARAIAADTNNPHDALKKLGPLVSMGTASLADAQIVLMPEVHDDPESQMVQLMLLAQEKQKNRPFIVLDESLESLEKSSWEIFSQKTMEILAAEEHKKQNKRYSPRDFEASLKNLASKFREHNGDLSYSRDGEFWTLSPFSNKATPFYGWDMGQRDSLTFLKDKKYALVFSKKFYKALKNVVAEFKGRSGDKSCIEL